MTSSGATSANPGRSDRAASRELEAVDGIEQQHAALPPGATSSSSQPCIAIAHQIARHLLPQDVGFVFLREQHVLLEAVVLATA